MPRSHGVGWGGYVNVPSTKFLRPCARCWCHDHMEWGGDVITFLRSRSLDLAQDVDATLTWGGVGWGGYVNVPSTKFPRPCARCWCHDHMEWGGDVITFLRSRSLDLGARCWCYAHMGWGGVGWVCQRSLDQVPSTLRKMLMPRSHGVGWGCYNVPSVTFPRPCARCWCYAHMGWGGVGSDVKVPSTTFPRPCARCWCDAHMGWGGFWC